MQRAYKEDYLKVHSLLVHSALTEASVSYHVTDGYRHSIRLSRADRLILSTLILEHLNQTDKKISYRRPVNQTNKRKTTPMGRGFAYLPSNRGAFSGGSSVPGAGGSSYCISGSISTSGSSCSV